MPISWDLTTGGDEQEAKNIRAVEKAQINPKAGTANSRRVVCPCFGHYYYFMASKYPNIFQA